MQLIIFSLGDSVAHRIHRLKAAVKRMRKRKTAYLISPMGGTQSSCSDRQADRSAQRAQTRGRNVSGVRISNDFVRRASMLKHNRFAKSAETKTYGLKSLACVAAFLLLMAGVAVAQIL